MTERLAIDYTLDPVEARVLCTLRAHVGRAAAIRVADLAGEVFGRGYLGFGVYANTRCNERELQKVVKRLREEHGQPILSSAGKPAGYFLAQTVAEIDACLAELHDKGVSILVTRRALKRHRARLLGQQEIAA